MPSLSDLLRMGKQYIGDALPGGSLNPEVSRQSVLDGAAMALSPVPVLGDIVGLGADANRYATDPESRTPVNYGLTALGALPFIPSVTAWHGSPHKFDKFSLDKIGTGEGAQAYGHGLYLAESPEVAKSYRTDKPLAAFDGTLTENDLMSRLSTEAGTSDPKIVFGLLQKKIGEGFGVSHGQAFSGVLGKIKSPLDLPNPSNHGGALYKTDIPDEAVARFLDWDKPLSQQAPEVQAALSKLGVKTGETAEEIQKRMINYGMSPSESAVYAARNAYTNTGELAYAELGRNAVASEKLRQAGIPGIRYLDGGSRSAGQGSSNFVAFDPEMIRILERNGVPTGQKPWNPNEYRPLSDLMNPRID